MKPEQLAVMHWGTYRVTTDNGKLTAVSPVAWDSNPSRIGQSLPGAVQMSTGAWYDPENTEDEQPLDKHGNPNVLTEDRGSSRLGQGCAAQSCRVEIVRFEGPLPAVTAWEPPAFVTLAQQKQA